jgi:arginyl-tRNA synthetase
MKDFKKSVAEKIYAVEKISDCLDFDQVYEAVEVPTDNKMGDYAFPCFKLAKEFRTAPPKIAEELRDSIDKGTEFELIENANAYLNFYVNRESLVKETVETVLKEKEDYGRSDVGQNKKVVVEFSSPNIAKPFHIGHIRSTVIGNAINNIYSFVGYDTVRINHLGDYGTQFGKMIVAYRKWGKKEDVEQEPIKTLLSYYTKFHEESEQNPELEDAAREAFLKLEQGATEEIELWQWFRDESLKEFNRVYSMLGIEFDSFAGESFYSDKMGRVLEELKEKNLLKESEGAQIVDLDEYGLGKALITKKDGSTLYITRDVAAAIYRKEHYDFYKNLYIVASQQNLHFQQWIKIIELLGYEWAHDCVHIPFGLVSLEEGTMSTRAGRVVFLEDVLLKAVEQTKNIIEEKNVTTGNVDEIAKDVGIGAVIFNELSNNRIKDYVFSWSKILSFEGETGPYVQYSHARAASVLRKAAKDAERIADGAQNIDASYLVSDRAYELSKLIYNMPQVIVEAAEKYEPSIVTRHIVDVAQTFNRFYQDEHILVDNEDEKAAKLALVIAAKNAIRNGLLLLGMKAPERM